MTEGADLTGYVEPICELVDDFHAIAQHLNEKVRKYERLLIDIHEGAYGCSTHNQRVAIAEAMKDG